MKVIDADFLPGNGPPFIVFEYVDGLDVGEMIEGNLFAPEDALELARQVASGLVHLHEHGVFHCDIKPRNLLWTERGAKIIDFNVSVLAADGERARWWLASLPAAGPRPRGGPVAERPRGPRPLRAWASRSTRR